MKIIFAAACLAAISLSSPMIAAAKDADQGLVVPPIEYEEWQLDNGLRVIAIHDDTTPNIMVSMWFAIGSKLDPERMSGFSHLFEHVLSRKTQNMPYNAINAIVDDVGGRRNASNGPSRTYYYEIVPSQYLERMLWTHAERLARPVIDQEVMDTERDVVKEEMRQRVLGPPYGRLSRFVMPENIYTRLPQRRPGIGSTEDLDRATIEDVRNFHAAYYGPDTATLIVAGNFDRGELRAHVDKHFGAIEPRPTAYPLDITIEEAPVTPRTVTAFAPRVPRPAILRAYMLPSADHPDMAALELLVAILSSGDNNRTSSALVRTGLAAADLVIISDSAERGYLAVGGIVGGRAGPAQFEAALDVMIADLLAEGVSDDELFEARNEMLADILENREVFSSRALELGEALMTTGRTDFADERIRRLNAVSTEDVLRVARLYLDPSKELRINYERGEDDPDVWANPEPMPAFRALPEVSREQFTLLPEGARDAPPAPGLATEYTAPVPVTGELGNGMEYVAIDTGDTPIATISVVIEGGASVDPRRLAGRAAMTARLAERGTSEKGAAQIAAGFERLGASFATQTDSDGTVFSVTAPVERLEEAGVLMAELLRDASFPEAAVEREQRRSLDRLRRTLSDPGRLASALVQPVVFGEGAYGNMPSGTPQSLTEIDRPSLLEFKEMYWQPSNARVILSGGLEVDRAALIAEAVFGGWRSERPAPLIERTADATTGQPRTLVINLEGAEQAAVYVVAPGYARGTPDYLAASLANAELGGSSTARLYRAIRVERGLAYSPFSSLRAFADGGYFAARAQTRNENAAAVARLMLEQMDAIAAARIDGEALDHRRLLQTGRFQRLTERSSGIGEQVAYGLLLGQKPAEVMGYPEALEKIDPAAAQAAIAELFDPQKISVIIVGDADVFADEIRAMRGEIEVVEADQLDLATARAAAQ